MYDQIYGSVSGVYSSASQYTRASAWVGSVYGYTVRLWPSILQYVPWHRGTTASSMLRTRGSYRRAAPFAVLASKQHATRSPSESSHVSTVP